MEKAPPEDNNAKTTPALIADERTRTRAT